MALRKPFVISSEGFHEELPVADALDVGAITINASGAGIDAGAKKVTNVGDGSSAGDALNKAQIDALVTTGNIFKEPVFAQNQLIDGSSGGIAALLALFFANQPIATDYIEFEDGTNTERYTFVANIGAEALPNDVSIESSAVTAMQRLVLRMNADPSNTFWLAEFHAPGEFNTDGEIHVIELKTPVDAISTSRAYGVWGTQADCQAIPFSDGTTAIQYNEGVAANLLAADPTDGRMGLSRAEGTLVDGEVHLALDLNAQFSWEDTAQVWNQISGVGAIPDATSGSGGGVKGVTHFDEDKGLQVVSDGLAEVRLEASKGIQFESGGGLGVKIDDTPDTLDVDSDGLKVVGVPTTFKIAGTAVSSAVSAANLDTLVAGASSDAQSLHTHDDKSETSHGHAHSSLSGVTSDQHHAKAHVLDGADHTLSGATAGHILTATSATTFAFAAAGAASEVPKIEDTVTTATDAVANGDPVYINGNNTYGKGRADTDAKARITGVTRTGGGAAPASIEVVTAGPCTAVLAGGGVANVPYYLQATGGIGTALPGAGSRVICVGYALNANDLFVRITDYGKKAA